MLQPLRLQWHGPVSDEQQREIARLGAVNAAVAAAPEPGEADVHGDVDVDDEAEDRSVAPAATQGRWFARADLDGVGIPSPVRKLLDAALPH